MPDLGRPVGGFDRWRTKWAYDNVSGPTISRSFVKFLLFSYIMQKSRNLNAFNQRQYWRGDSGLSLCVLESRNSRMSRLLFSCLFDHGCFQFGTIAFWIMGVMTLYCMHQLLRCHDFYRYRWAGRKMRCENILDEFGAYLEHRDKSVTLEI